VIVTPQISVIVPVYNTASWLDQCVASVLSQTFQDFELILVDDGSTDDSGRLCEAWATRDPRVVVIHTPNGGVSSARNRGIAAARGEYLAFIDSDDWVDAELLEVLLSGMTTDVDWSVCGLKTAGGGDGSESRIGPPGVFEAQALPESLVENALRTYWIFQPVCKLYRRELISRHQLAFDPTLSLGEDLAFNLAYLSRVRRFRLNDRALYSYRMLHTGLASSFNPRKPHSVVVLSQSLLEFVRGRGLFANQIRSLVVTIILENFSVVTSQLAHSRNIPLRHRREYFRYMRSSNALQACIPLAGLSDLTLGKRVSLALNTFFAWQVYLFLCQLFKRQRF
jgi:glycosyltransferase involved in cell wall biosynthesis